MECGGERKQACSMNMKFGEAPQSLEASAGGKAAEVSAEWLLR